jgi:hypothetical protein
MLIPPQNPHHRALPLQQRALTKPEGAAQLHRGLNFKEVAVDRQLI